MHHLPFRIVLLLFLLFRVLPDATGQVKYLFIEPNISISYDSTLFKVGERYSNTYYKTEAYDFSYLGDTLNKVVIHVKAEHPLDIPISGDKLIDLMEEKAAFFGQMNDTAVAVLEYEKQVRQLADFYCAGAILQDKKSGHTYTAIVCNHNSRSDLTEIRLSSENRRSLSEDYAIIAVFLKGFATYSPALIAREEARIKARYRVKVTPVSKPPENMVWRSNNYFALVRTVQPLAHVLKEVRVQIEYGAEIFYPNDKGEVFIAIPATGKGPVKRKAELVLLNSFGKQVSIPFVAEFNAR